MPMTFFFFFAFNFFGKKSLPPPLTFRRRATPLKYGVTFIYIESSFYRFRLSQIDIVNHNIFTGEKVHNSTLLSAIFQTWSNDHIQQVF